MLAVVRAWHGLLGRERETGGLRRGGMRRRGMQGCGILMAGGDGPIMTSPETSFALNEVPAGSCEFLFRCEFLHKAMLSLLGSPVSYRVWHTLEGCA